MTKSRVLKFFDLIKYLLVGSNFLGTIDLRRYRTHLVPQGHIVRVQRAELCSTLVDHRHHVMCQFLSTRATIRPVGAVDGGSAEFGGLVAHLLDFSIGIDVVSGVQPGQMPSGGKEGEEQPLHTRV